MLLLTIDQLLLTTSDGTLLLLLYVLAQVILICVAGQEVVLHWFFHTNIHIYIVNAGACKLLITLVKIAVQRRFALDKRLPGRANVSYSERLALPVRTLAALC